MHGSDCEDGARDNGEVVPASHDAERWKDDEDPFLDNVRIAKFPPVTSRRCGVFDGKTLDALHSVRLAPSRHPEHAYAQRFQTAFKAVFPSSLQEPELAVDDPSVDKSSNFATQRVLDSAKSQKEYFEALDAFQDNPDSTGPIGMKVPGGDVNFSGQVGRVKDALDSFGQGRAESASSAIQPSETVVVEAVIHLILKARVVDVRSSGRINIKMARVLLWWACWLQDVRHAAWHEEGKLPPPPSGVVDFSKGFRIALIGPGGTGKTTVLLMIEAIVEYFMGPNTVNKCALSNTASRLLGGDTLHALCKLPRADLQSLRGKLTTPALRTLKRRWRNTAALFVDEISMVAPSQLHQADIRVRQATEQPHYFFGKLAVSFSGDFLQLPPVEMRSLAKPLTTSGQLVEGVEAPVGEDDGEQVTAETRQGIMAWHGVHNVVSLTLPLRSQDALSRLLAEMRSGCISDEMWALYQSRKLVVNDARLKQPPFSTSPRNFIVHRHSLRSMLSFWIAKETSITTKKCLYMVTASDQARVGDELAFTKELRSSLLEQCNPRKTSNLPGCLPLHVGMRLLLFTKDCVRLGLMNGCECILEDILFAEEEELPSEHLCGEYFQLRWMPLSLLLRDPSAAWMLPSNHLPKLLPHIDPRGLFQLKPSSGYIRVKVDKDHFISVRRTQFRVLPADTRVVYGAQGETMKAGVVDMQKPPIMNDDIFWLACYVMMSRVTSIDGLLVLRPASSEQNEKSEKIERGLLSRPPPAYLVAEHDRLQQLECASTKTLWEHLRSLPFEIPDDIAELFAEQRETETRAADRRSGARAADTATEAPTSSKRLRLWKKTPAPRSNERLAAPSPAPAQGTKQPRQALEPSPMLSSPNSALTVVVSQASVKDTACAAKRPRHAAAERPDAMQSSCGKKPLDRLVSAVETDSGTPSTTLAHTSGVIVPCVSGGEPTSSSSSTSPSQAIGQGTPGALAMAGSAATCSKCDRTSCSPANPQCPYFGRDRHSHPDGGWGDTVPHLTQTEWRMDGDTVVVDGMTFTRGLATGVRNNCLIDALRQTAGVSVNVDHVRSQLQVLFPNGPQRVSECNYLELQFHGKVGARQATPHAFVFNHVGFSLHWHI